MPVFENLQDMKEMLQAVTPKEFFDSFVLTQTTKHFDEDALALVCETIAAYYDVEVAGSDLVVVGSSKLGFALHEKKIAGQPTKPAFRSFDEQSDIDLAICSTRLFELLWKEIGGYACQQKKMPLRLRSFGDYLTYGWFRADQLPFQRENGLLRCYDLKVARGKVRRDHSRGHPKVDFGIFYDLEHLSMYQERSIAACQSKLENPL